MISINELIPSIQLSTLILYCSQGLPTTEKDLPTPQPVYGFETPTSTSHSPDEAHECMQSPQPAIVCLPM